MASGLFGWELLYASVEKDIKSNQDVLVCFVHLVLVSNGFKCIGLGDSKNIDGSETQSEALPKGWNDNYAIRYMYQGRLYNLRGTALDDAVMVNLIRVDERTVSMIQLNTRLVLHRSGNLDKMIPDNVNVSQTIKRQLIDKIIVSAKSRESGSQTDPVQEPRNPPPGGAGSNVPTPPPLIDPNPTPRFSHPNLVDPFNIGHNDVHPFGRDPLRVYPEPGRPIGGGMLFQPPQGPRYNPGPNIGIPGGSIPPGARFDPFRPPDVDRFPRRPHNPDNDEMPPPGFDDMYM